MKKNVKIILAGLLLLTLLNSCNSTLENGIKVSYIGSSGFLIETENMKIMIDGAFDNYVARFEVTVPSKKTRELIANGLAPFDEIDLFLVSHSHKGHFNPHLLSKAIMSNPNAQVISNRAVYEDLERIIPQFDSFKERLYFPDLKIGESRTRSVEDIVIHMTKTSHWDDLMQLNYEFLVDGINIVYALESEGFVNKADVDLQFLGTFDSKLNPKYLILTHQSGKENKKVKREKSELLENVSFLMNSLEELTLIKKDNGFQVR